VPGMPPVLVTAPSTTRRMALPLASATRIDGPSAACARPVRLTMSPIPAGALSPLRISICLPSGLQNALLGSATGISASAPEARSIFTSLRITLTWPSCGPFLTEAVTTSTDLPSGLTSNRASLSH